ncbi:hypothetical protein EI94DRAFT_1743695 [Lactarius quietus]|nr:hypothetical protein EI94DRAFT_1743695 [Lactarius quietus]
MPQLKTITLHSATPVLPLDASLPSVIERIVTIPLLSCGLALAHLSLPALTQLYLTVTSHQRDGKDVREILPHVSRHAHRLQQTQPLQSLLVDDHEMGTDILTWTPLSFFNGMLSTSLKFSFKNERWSPGSQTEVFDAAMATLPLDSLVTLISQSRPNPFAKQV